MIKKGVRIGWIGTGVMGKSMAGHIMQKGGYEVSVYTRTASKAADLIKNGAVWKPVE
jgi:3-hydroxyisobutyrate dehydrogenase